MEKVQKSDKKLKSDLNKLSDSKNEVENGYLLVLNDCRGFTSKDIAHLKILKDEYPSIKFFIFDVINGKIITNSEFEKFNNKPQ